ncbi:hypothetical protein ACFX1W_008219 [Malus domestica]
MKGRSTITIGIWKRTLSLAFLMMINRWWRFADLERITTENGIHPERNQRIINGRKERHRSSISGQLMQTKRETSCSSNLTTDEKLNINDDVATMGYAQRHSCRVPTTSEIIAPYYGNNESDYINYATGYDHYGATNCNWKEYYILEPREPPVHVYVDKYLMRSLDAENQMPPQLPPEMAEYIIMKAKSRRWPCQLLGWIMFSNSQGLYCMSSILAKVEAMRASSTA